MNATLAIVKELEPNETIANLITSIFTCFFPEIYKHLGEIRKEDEKNKKEDNIQIKMLSIDEADLMKKQNENFLIFKHITSFEKIPRLQSMNNFCYVNIKIINRLIKQKPQSFL